MKKAYETQDFSFLDSFADIQDLQLINKEIALLILHMRRISEQLDVTEKLKVKADIAYKRKYTQEYLKLENSKNETQRKLMAEMQAESEQIEVLKYEQLAKEKQRQIYTMRNEIDALRTIASNLKQELQIL